MLDFINKKYNINFIKEIYKDLDGLQKEYLLIYQKLSLDFIKKNYKDLDGSEKRIVLKYQKLSSYFIKEIYKELGYLQKEYLLQYQKLSLDFIKKIYEDLDYSQKEYLLQYQKLSMDFIKGIYKVLNYSQKEYLLKYQKLSLDFIKTNNLEDEINHYKQNGNWLYYSTQDKIDYINKNNLSELYDIYIDKEDINNSYLIAYKGIRSDWYSNFNFQYKYSLNKVFTCHSDCNSRNKNSFGLSAWTLEEARNYCNQKIVKVKIFLKDLSCFIHNNHKIRCSKFEVIEEV